MIGNPEDIASVLTQPPDPLTIWAMRAAILGLVGYIWRNERKQTSQDLALKDIQLDIERNRPHKDEFDKLREAVERVDRLVRLIAAKQGISTGD